MSDPLILLVDDDEDLCRYCRAALKPLGVQLLTCGTVEDGRRSLQNEEIDLLLADLELPDGSGLDLLDAAKAQDADLVVTLVTGKGTIPSALEAMKRGAFDYLLKPVPPLELRAHVNKALAHRKLLLENRSLRRQLAAQRAEQRIIGNSGALGAVLRIIEKVAPHDTTVLITGESGTGKELVARTLHERSRRTEGPFVAVNCSALPETLLESELFGHERGAFTGAVASRKGVFAQANGGTLFLDEIGTMPAGLQAKLLRVLEEGRVRPLGAEREMPVDVRVITATNADLGSLMQARKFREDLYYRLKVMTIALPPLRDRREDVPLLARHFLERLRDRGKVAKISPEALGALESYCWPGNVRELSNVIERACLLAESDTLTLELLPEEVVKGPAPEVQATSPVQASTLAESEKAQILKTLERTGGRRTRTAELLGISRRTLYNKLRRYNIAPPPETNHE